MLENLRAKLTFRNRVAFFAGFLFAFGVMKILTDWWDSFDFVLSFCSMAAAFWLYES